MYKALKKQIQVNNVIGMENPLYYRNKLQYPVGIDKDGNPFHPTKENGYKIALLSDFPPEQKKDIWGTAPLCDVIMGSEQCGALKPSIYTFGTLIKKLDLPAENILYVGNSIRADITGAKRAGMKTAYIMPFWRKLFNRKLKQWKRAILNVTGYF